MKLTWFGDTTFRIHAGGQIAVVVGKVTPVGAEASEIRSGADRVVALGDDEAAIDLRNWKPRPGVRLVDAGDAPRPVEVHRGGGQSLLIDGEDDLPLLILAGSVPEVGRWIEKAMVVLVGPDLLARAQTLLEQRVPRLIALASIEAEFDAAFAQLPERLDGAGLIALQPGLAVEV